MTNPSPRAPVDTRSSPHKAADFTPAASSRPGALVTPVSRLLKLHHFLSVFLSLSLDVFLCPPHEIIRSICGRISEPIYLLLLMHPDTLHHPPPCPPPPLRSSARPCHSGRTTCQLVHYFSQRQANREHLPRTPTPISTLSLSHLLTSLPSIINSGAHAVTSSPPSALPTTKINEPKE